MTRPRATTSATTQNPEGLIEVSILSIALHRDNPPRQNTQAEHQDKNEEINLISITFIAGN
jgi:hypothetical protein